MAHELANRIALSSLIAPKVRSRTVKVSAEFPEQGDATGALTRAIARGDEEAFRKFYDQYSGRIFGLLLVMTSGQEEVARELHQVVMIKVARKLPVFDSEGPLWAWLSQVARNAFRDHLRTELRRQKGNHAHATGAAAIENSEPDLLPEWLEDALRLLDEEERLLIEAVYFENQRQTAIAETSGQSVKAVESKLTRARAKLRALILKRIRHEN